MATRKKTLPEFKFEADKPLAELFLESTYLKRKYVLYNPKFRQYAHCADCKYTGTVKVVITCHPVFLCEGEIRDALFAIVYKNSKWNTEKCPDLDASMLRDFYGNSNRFIEDYFNKAYRAGWEVYEISNNHYGARHDTRIKTYRQRWLDELRTTKVRKCHGSLEISDKESNTICRSVLGVACNLFRDEFFLDEGRYEGGRVYHDYRDSRELPLSVQDALCISPDGFFKKRVYVHGKGCSTLMDVNDRTDLNMAEMADVIETNFAKNNFKHRSEPREHR